MTVPVYNVIGLFCADDTEGVDGSIGRCEVGVLSWSPGKTPCWALTASQKLTHTGEKTSESYGQKLLIVLLQTDSQTP